MHGNRVCVLLHRVVIVTIAIFALFASPVKAQYTYQLDGWTNTGSGLFGTGFVGMEDILITNSFTVVPGAQTLTSITFLAGFDNTVPAYEFDQAVTAMIYTGTSLTDPTAGGGLQRIAASTTTTTVEMAGAYYGQFGSPGGPLFDTVDLASPVTLPVGQVFYAGLLFHDVGVSEAPWGYDTNLNGPSPPYQNQSFEGYGFPTYSIDDYSDLMPSGVGNLVLRANAVPEPGADALIIGAGASGLGLLIWRRRRC